MKVGWRVDGVEADIGFLPNLPLPPLSLGGALVVVTRGDDDEGGLGPPTISFRNG